MPQGQPSLLVAFDLYNKLIFLPYSEQEEISSIEWRLRKLHKKSPSELHTSVALLQALLMAGNTKEAHALADEIWGKQYLLSSDAKLTFMGNLVDLGMFERFFEMAAPFQNLVKVNNAHFALFATAGFGSGDIDRLNRIDADISPPGFVSNLQKFFARLKNAGIFEHFFNHQKIIHNLIFGKFASYTASISSGDDLRLDVLIFMNADRAERRALEQKIDDELISYYSRQGCNPVAYSDLIITIISDIRSRWAPKLAGQ